MATRSMLLVMAAIVGGAAVAQDAAGPRSLELTECRISLVDEAKVAAREAGVLVKVLVSKGDRVSKGQPLAQIDDDQPRGDKDRALVEHKQAVEKSRNTVDVRFAKEALELAKLDLEKSERARTAAPNSVTEIVIKEKELAVTKAELGIEQAEFQLKLESLTAEAKMEEVEAAENAIERRVIRSPLEGYVNDLAKHEGEWMQPGDMLAHVINPAKLRVEGYVELASVPRSAVDGRPVKVMVDLEKGRREVFEGTITFVSETVESGDYRVAADVVNRMADGRALLPAGHFATMVIDLGGPTGR